MRILIVEDEAPLREGLVDLLRAAGHAVEEVGDGERAVAQSTAEDFDLILLDLMLPGIDGFEVCRRLRRVRPDMAILMLTARGAEDDKVTGLGVGADDYVTKPFSARELLARIAALGRRMQAHEYVPEVLTADGCRLDLARLHAERHGRVEALTPREVEILRWLYRHRARAVARPELLEHVWRVNADMQTRTVDMAVAKLRQKIERDPAAPRIVVTITGVGYAWGGDEGL